ncbi:MAG: SPOR domain-containing protein [Bacteroidetes bacterium]|nr:SPOR domain-containing protein [Bacteroidota bacterium]MBL0064450.1 SPOR domain-containing protein [Bacteroidota bacterium]MBL0137625.1 SPOR domain-containing protein [Bacteroidota bacterium]
MSRLLFFICFLGLFSSASAQKTITTANSDSSIRITRDPRLDELIERQKQINLEKQSMPGFRVQIYFGGNRPKASEVKLDFNSRYPDIPAYLTYQQPNFKVRVGDFRNRYEAQKLIKELEGKYPTTFVVPDEVKLPLLK